MSVGVGEVNIGMKGDIRTKCELEFELFGHKQEFDFLVEDDYALKVEF